MDKQFLCFTHHPSGGKIHVEKSTIVRFGEDREGGSNFVLQVIGDTLLPLSVTETMQELEALIAGASS